MLYCELVTVTYRLSSGKRRLVYSISTTPALSFSLFPHWRRTRIEYCIRIYLVFVFSSPLLRCLYWNIFSYILDERICTSIGTKGKRKKRCGRANESLAFPVNCGFMVYRSGETFYRWSITSRWQRNVPAKMNPASETRETHMRGTYSPARFVFRSSWLEYRIQAVA